MTEDPAADIDTLLSEALPEWESDSSTADVDPRRAQLLEYLQQAADELGRSPSMGDFNRLDYGVSADTIKHVFGSWNAAKEAAGLDTLKRGTVTNINETYFRSLDTSAKVYWFGTLVATSSIHQHEDSENYHLSLGRVEDKAYFVTAFADAIDSEYALLRYDSSKSDKQQVQLIITNPTFVEYLIEAGYPTPADDPSGFPEVPEAYRTAFIRGFLESSGYFTTTGWQIKLTTMERGETMQAWLEAFGAKRPTLSQPQGKSTMVRVTNPFDVAAVFESLYPDRLDTKPSWTPYPERILSYLASEHPYPENLTYLDG